VGSCCPYSLTPTRGAGDIRVAVLTSLADALLDLKDLSLFLYGILS
jgi:hypothetical protein